MARTPFNAAVRAAALIILSTLALSGCLPGASATVAWAQDSWTFPWDQRSRRGGSDSSGPKEGDRPLEPKGGRNAYPGEADERPRGDDTPRTSGSRSAAPVAVDRQELAPLATPPPEPSPPASAGTPPSPQWDTRTTPIPRDQGFDDRGFLPTPRRDREFAPFAPQPTPPARSSAYERPPPPSAPPARSASRPSIDGIATIEPKVLEDIVDGVELPPKSATIAALWPEPWLAASGQASPAFEAIRIEALRRAGAVDTLKAVLDRVVPPKEPVLAVVVLRAQLLVGNREAGCALAGEAIRNRASLPANFRRDAVLAAGYCGLASGNAEAAKLTIDLIRGEKIDAPFALAVLGGSGKDGKAPPPLPSTIGVLDYRIDEVAGLVWPNTLVDRAEPAVLAVIATAPTIDPGLRIIAAERAARLAIVPPGVLAEQYRALPVAPEDVANGLATRQTGAMRRAVLMQAAIAERSPDKKARLLAALLDDAAKAGLRAAVARTLGPLVEQMRPAPDMAWFGDSASEILVYSGRGSAVEGWAALTRDLDHWRVLGALATDADTPSGSALASLERIARAGRMEAPRLHRVVTVLDALDVQIPIPLWEAASRTPQPTDGHLPATGVLGELKTASDKREGGRAILRAAQALGPASAANANLLTLGDIIRALKSAGFQREARAVGIEALIESWPSAAGR